MDPTALYYALSIIAQCAAALAALLGFLALWRLDVLRRGREEAERDLRQAMAHPPKVGGDVTSPESAQRALYEPLPGRVPSANG